MRDLGSRDSENLLEIRDLEFTYPGADEPALDGVNLSISEGSICGLLGPNGSGKTTLISILAGVLERDAGQTALEGAPIDSPRSREKIGLVPQELAIYLELSAIENLSFYGGFTGLGKRELKNRIEFALEVADLTSHARRRAQEYSGGMRRRLNLAVALVGKPNLLLLDEPTVGVDPQSRIRIFECLLKLAEEGTSILYTTHHMEEAERLCEDVYIIDNGRIIESGKIAELTGERDLESLFMDLTGRELRD